MANYRLPMDADGVKYHGTVDQNEENPGHFMYGLDENGNKRIIRTDEQGNVLTRVTGSKVEETLVNAEAITDTSPKYSNHIEVVNYTDFYIVINSTLDKVLTFGVQRINGVGRSAYPVRKFVGGGENHQSIVVNVEGNRGAYYITDPLFKFLESFQFFYVCREAPTEGSVSVYIVGKEGH